MSYEQTLKVERHQKFRLFLDSRYRAPARQTKAELQAELTAAVRNTAALPLHADGLPHNAQEGEGP